PGVDSLWDADIGNKADHVEQQCNAGEIAAGTVHHPNECFHNSWFTSRLRLGACTTIIPRTWCRRSPLFQRSVSHRIANVRISGAATMAAASVAADTRVRLSRLDQTVSEKGISHFQTPATAAAARSGCPTSTRYQRNSSPRSQRRCIRYRPTKPSKALK